MRHRVTASVLALVLVTIAAGCGGGDDDQATRRSTTTTSAASTTKASVTGPKNAVGPNTIAIFAPASLSKVLEQLSSAYKDQHPGIAFQITTGETNVLLQQLLQGARPNIYIDDTQVIGRLNKSLVKGTPVTFGTDTVVAVTKVGNPKGIRDLRAFGADPRTSSGLCDPQIACGIYGRQLLEAAKVAPIPDVVDSSEPELVDRVAGGDLDTALVMRSASRTRFGKLGGIPLWLGPKVEIEYKVVPIEPTPNSTDFTRFATEFAPGKRILAIRGFLPLAVLKQP